MNLDRIFRKALYLNNGSDDEEAGRSSFPSLEELDRAKLYALFEHAADVNIHAYFKEDEAGARASLLNPLLIYCDGMIDTKQLNDFLYLQLRKLLTRPPSPDSSSPFEAPIETQNVYRIEGRDAVQNMLQQVFSGNLVLYFEPSRELFAIQMAAPPQREPSESNTEISVKGPRDGFTEAIDANVALIRKRLKTPTLGIEYYRLGTRSVTSIALLYMTDITNPELLAEARSRLQKIEIDGVLSSQLLEEALADSSYSLFPLIEYMGRPDYIASSLLRGRFAIVVDGSPMALVGPTNLMSLIKSPEDLHLPFYYVSLERILRVAGLIIAIFFSGVLGRAVRLQS